MKVKIKQQLRPINEENIDALESVVFLVCADKKLGKDDTLPHSSLLKQRLKRQGKSQWGSTPFTTTLPNRIGTHVSVSGIKASCSSFDLLTACRQIMTGELSRHPKSVTITVLSDDEALVTRGCQTLLAALLAATHVLPNFKKKAEKAKPLETIVFAGLTHRIDFTRTLAEAEGNNLARCLTSLPPNRLTPSHFRKEVQKLARQHGWQFTFLDQKTLKQKKAGAFLAVAQGSENNEAGIVHLRYRPTKGARKKAKLLSLIGKGICFDTGGTNLKPAKSMHGMHQDMEGSAVALGTFLALSELNVNFPVDCWLALSENMIGPRAYKQNDVVVAGNGLSIEIVHTDAEGRMILADTLHLAAKTKPTMIIDYATLTGACAYSLGTSYSGAFTNRMHLLDDIIAAGRDSGERVWPFPNDDDYDSALDSDCADLKQCTLGGEADHIVAASFLKRFIDDTPWLHIDLSAGNHKGGLAHIPTDITGFGVRYTLELILSRNVLEAV